MVTHISHLAAGFAWLLAFWAGCAGHAELAGAARAPVEHESLIRLTVGGTPDKVVVELAVTAPMSTALEPLGDPPDRLFVDLVGVAPAVPETTEVNMGAVTRVRIALNQAEPPVTRVVLDVEAPTRYRIEDGERPGELRIVVESDLPKLAVETDSYAAWFTRTAAALGRLLEQTADVSIEPWPGGLDTQVVLEWDTVRHHLGTVTPPPDLAPAHQLLVTAGTVGHAAVSGRSSGVAVEDVRSAAAGAAILLEQAEHLAAPHLSTQPLVP